MPYAIPLVELRRLISAQTMPILQEFFVEYTHCGAPHRFEVQHGVPTKGSDSRLAEAPPWAVRKLLAFRSTAAAPHGARSSSGGGWESSDEAQGLASAE